MREDSKPFSQRRRMQKPRRFSPYFLFISSQLLASGLLLIYVTQA
jgi:putative copper export protein